MNSASRLVAILAMLVVPCVSAARAHAQDAQPAGDGGRTRVVVLGSGTPGANPERFGPAIVVLVDSSAYLFDAGVGVIRRWAAAVDHGVTTLGRSGLRTLFVTHLHSDHTLGYPDLILSSWTLDPEVPPLEAYGPDGLQAMTDNILAAYTQDIGIRTGAGGENEGARPPRVNVHEIAGGVVYTDSLVKVNAFSVKHGTWPQAFGYRITTPDKVIVLSGDAANSPAVAEMCNGCDLLLHEGGSIPDADARSYFRAFHTTTEQLAKLAEAARPKLLVLYHQRAADAATDRAYRTLRSHYTGAFVVARDLDVFY